MATITLESISQPGEWEAYGVTDIGQTLYTVSVTFAGALPLAGVCS